MTEPDTLAGKTAAYYSDKLARFGATPRGVDWNGEQAQQLRFDQLLRICADNNNSYSLNDIGCGYGALYGYLQHNPRLCRYDGCDLAAPMIEAAISRYGLDERHHFHHAAQCPQVADYAVASGIFSVMLDNPREQWEDHIRQTLAGLDQAGCKGFAFNCLTSYSDPDRMRPDLYYGDPCHYFDYCKRTFSRNVALLHDYDLYEFTILVRKE